MPDILIKKTIFMDPPDHFSFKATVLSHGWCELAPFELDEASLQLSYTFRDKDGRSVRAQISEGNGKIRIDLFDPKVDVRSMVNDVRHLLRFDEDLAGFYEAIGGDERLSWVCEKRAGRLLRSASVFEDLVKTICTTNCSWGLTKSMVTNLVEKLGAPAVGGGRAFPTPNAMAAVSADFYREEIKAGYRSSYLAELADSVASGNLNPEDWINSEIPSSDLKQEMKKVRGVGNYAAEHLLKLVGRYDGLALDSWLRSQFYKNHNDGNVCPDAKIESHYERFGRWRGLVIWCDMTEK